MVSIDDTGLSKILVIDSSKKISGPSCASFTVGIGNSNEAHKVSKVSLVSFSGFNTVYNITEINNKFSILTDVDAQFDLTITPGFYSISELDTLIETAVNGAITNVFSMAVNSNTLKETFSIDVGTFTLVPVANSIYRTLGLDEANLPVAVATFTSAYVLALSGVTAIYLRSQAIAANNSAESDGTSSNILAIIPVTSAFGAPVSYTSPTEESDTILYNGTTDLTTMDIQLTDNDGNILCFNGGEVDIVLKIYYHR